jgi:tetratricopeptide (TPR) repeat protein
MEPALLATRVPVSMQVWPELTAGRVGQVLFLDRPGRAQELNDMLVIGEPGLGVAKSTGDGNGSLRVTGLRIRRLTSPQPPARLAPPAERSAYWTARLEEQPGNTQFLTRLSDARFAEGKFEEALKLADEPSATFALARRVKALALYRLQRYSEAMPLLMAANKECDGNDFRVTSAIGAVICAAADPALRKVDDETVTSVQAGHWYAREAINSGGNDEPEPLATIALAAAAEGKFDEARQQNLEAIRLAAQRNDTVLEQELRQRQAIYESNQAVTLP